jgi:hypothetical protein
VIVPAVAVNVAVVAPAATVTDPGTVRPVALLVSVTVAPPVFDTITVQLLVAPLFKDVGVHAILLTTTAVAKAIDAVWVLPFSAAVTVAV